MSASYRPMVVADSTGKFNGNALRFASREEAERSALSLALRWTLVTDWRVDESDDPPNYRFPEGAAREEPHPPDDEIAAVRDGSAERPFLPGDLPRRAGVPDLFAANVEPVYESDAEHLRCSNCGENHLGKACPHQHNEGDNDGR